MALNERWNYLKILVNFLYAYQSYLSYYRMDNFRGKGSCGHFMNYR